MGVLALVCSLFVLILLTFLFWPGSELVAKPTGIVGSVPEAILSESEPVNVPVISGNITNPAGAVSLDEPRPKISPELVKELKELKKDRKRAKVLINVKDDAALVALQKTVSDAGGQITQSFAVGDVAVVELPADKVEEVSRAVGVEEISNEREYVAFLSDRIPAFGVDKVWEGNITGKNVKIAVLDTGVGPHANISVYNARSFVSGEDTADLNGHGTHVAGIAQGVARGAQIYNAKVLSRTGSGSTSQIIAGINWAADNDVDIISMSFGGMFTELDGPLASAVKEAIQRGVVFVVASGNCRQGCGGFFGVTTPGNVKEVITVGAVDDSNVVASFSSGDTFSDYIKPDVVAPGKDITSTWLNNGWKTLSGTSMSTPFVSGVVALMLEKESLTHSQVKARLESTATDLGTAGKDTSYGAGLVNVSGLMPVTVITVNETNATNVTNTTIPVNETIPIVPVSNETNEIPANATRPAPTFSTESRLITGNVSNFEFMRVSDASELGVSDQIAIYAKEDGRIYVQEMVFDNILDFTNFLYESVPLTSDNLSYLNGEYNYLSYENKTFWYNDNAIYSAKTVEVSENDLLMFLDEYSRTTDNNVKRNYDDTLKSLEELDKKIIKYVAQTNSQVTSSEKNDSFQPLYGGDTPSSAYTLTFGQSYWESFYTQGAQNWYYTSTTQKGTLEFGVKDISNKDDLDIYVYDYTGTSLMCSSTNSGQTADYCTVSKTTTTNWGFYIKIIPYRIDGAPATSHVYSFKQCTEGWTSSAMQCYSGNEVFREYQYRDCSKAYIKVDDCDNYNDPGSWYCDSTGNPRKVSYTYTCSGSGLCPGTSSTQTSTCTSAQKCSSGSCINKVCSDYANNEGTCASYNYYAIDSTECVNGNAVDCDIYGNTYCWKILDICTSDEYCSNPLTSSAYCAVYPCTISSVSWDTTSAVVGSSVGITVQGSHCSSNDYVTFDVFENDCWGASISQYNESQIDTGSFNQSGSNETNLTAQGVCNHAVNTKPSKAYFSSNTAKSTWTAEYKSDIWGNPEYYAWAYLNGNTNDDTGSGNELTVTCGDSDADGYSNSGGDCGNSDCNDNDANIHPGATERCNNIDDDCDSSVDEGIDLKADVNNCGSCGNACGTGGACHDGQCYSTQCANYADTSGSCSSKGQYQKQSSKIYECQNMLWWGTLLCWKKVASKGDSNYCSLMTCSHGEYDCEDGQCASNLVCDGHWIGSDGCCYPNTEEWDGYSNTCKKTDGQPCTDGNQCIGNYCVHNACWNQPYKVGDSQCDAGAGETCSNSPVDCKKCDGASCSVASECRNGYCVHNACWNANYKVGDGYCDEPWESKSNSPNDCFGDLNVIQITSYPSIVNQGQTFVVKAKVKNIGTIRDTLKLEAGIAPDSWQNFVTSDEYGASVYPYLSTTKNCCGNDFYSAYQVTLDPAQEEEISFTLKAPTLHTVDGCNSSWNVWDSSHTLVVGLYNECFKGYVQYKAKDIKIRDKPCSRQSDCNTANEYCKFVNGAGSCWPKLCVDSCTTEGAYTCQGTNTLFNCTRNSNGCLQNNIISTCNAPSICVNGQSSCQNPPQTTVRIEYSDGSRVYKQPGDKVKLFLTYKRQETIQLLYNSAAFELDTSTCSNSFTIRNDKECVFTVKAGAGGSYYFGIANGESKPVTVTSPKAIMITNKNKLEKRFGEDTNGVLDLLKQAYQYASSEQNVIAIYNLEDYSEEISGFPWGSLGSYVATPYNPVIFDNGYSYNVAEFIKKKCKSGCADTIILGDDYVVPSFRRNISTTVGSLWWKEENVEKIYTDVGYIKKTEVEFKDLDKLFSEQSILFVVSEGVKSRYQSELNELAGVIESKDSSVTQIMDTEATCNSFGQLSGKTIVLFGNEESNRIISCLAYSSLQDSSITLDRSSWSPYNYVVVVNSENYPDPILTLSQIVKYGAKNHWAFGDAVVACLWDGKFEGAPCPTASEIFCNMIPVVELAPDIRDTAKCMFNTEKTVFDELFCYIVYAASGYDIVSYAGIVASVGVSAVPGEAVDLGIATVKTSVKNAVKTLSTEIARKALDTLLSNVRLVKFVFKLPLKAFGLEESFNIIKASFHILAQDPETAENTFKFITETGKSLKWTGAAANGLGYMNTFSKAKVPVKYGHMLNEGEDVIPKAAEFFEGDLFATSYNKFVKGMKLGSTAVQQIRFEFDRISGSWASFTTQYVDGEKIVRAIRIEAKSNYAFMEEYFLLSKSSDAKKDFWKFYSDTSLSSIQKEQKMIELLEKYPDEAFKIADEYKKTVIFESAGHEIAHARFHEVKTMTSDDLLYKPTYAFRDFLSDITVIKTSDADGAFLFKQYKKTGTFVSLLRDAEGKVNNEGITTLRQNIRVWLNEKDLRFFAQDRALAKEMGYSDGLITEYDDIVMEEARNILGEARATILDNSIKSLTNTYIQKGGEAVNTLKQAGNNAQQEQAIDEVLENVASQLSAKEYDVFDGPVN